jgi:hypothetical protein
MLSLEAGRTPSSIAVGDFKGDWVLDLAVANDGSDDVSRLLGNRDGTFQAALSFGGGRQPSFVATGDFNGDGRLDLVLADLDPIPVGRQKIS